MAEALGAGEPSVHEVVLTGAVDDVAWPPRDEQPEVLGRIGAALEAEPAWQVSSLGPTGPRRDERALWEKLSTSR
jgi:hypothetical protein